MPRSLNPFGTLLRRRDQDKPGKLYGSIVAQARLPFFYRSLGVPDTIEGRFAVLSLNLFAVLQRLAKEGRHAASLAQALIDRFICDMETVLRELGVGDLAVPKKMRALAASSHAQLEVYARVFPDGEDALADAIAEALPLEPSAAKAASRQLATYVVRVVQHLGTQPLASLVAGDVEFPATASATP